MNQYVALLLVMIFFAFATAVAFYAVALWFDQFMK